MLRLTTFLRSLGNVGAVTNVRTVMDARAREDWAVAGLVLRLGDELHESTPAAAVHHAA